MTLIGRRRIGGPERELDPPKATLDGLSPHRLNALADGIFAIAMTLLVLELRLPEGAGSDPLTVQLAALWPRFATFFLSFVVLGIYWFAQHQTFHFVIRVDRVLVWLSILYFMGAVLVPFVASLMGAHPDDPVAIAVYGAVLALLASVGYVIWWYVTGDRGLLDRELDPDLRRKVRKWIAAGPLVTPVAIALAFVNTRLALLFYLALPAIYIIVNPVDRYLDALRRSDP